MNCQELQPWLFASKAAGPLPPAVQRHLAACRKCRRRRRLLGQLDEQVRQLPLPPADFAARDQLWQRIGATAATAPHAGPVRPRWPMQLIGRVLMGTAACWLLLAVGWILGRSTVPVRPETAVAVQQPSARAAETSIILRVLRHDIRLAEAPDVDEQLTVLNLLAGDLKDEALRLARQGSAQDLTPLAELYERVLRDGIVRRAAALPDEKRAALVAPLVLQLRANDDDIRQAAHEALPVVADLLEPFRNASRESAELLETGRRPAEVVAPATAGRGFRPLLAALVQQALKLADETDPLRRADLCSELAALLTPALVVLAAGSDVQQAEEMGSCLGDLLERGVANNLDRAESEDAQGLRQAELDKVRERSVQAAAVFERNLEDAPPAAQAGLQRVVEASTEGRERVLQPGKPKGKPGHPGPPGKGKPIVPPGLKNKR